MLAYANLSHPAYEALLTQEDVHGVLQLVSSLTDVLDRPLPEVSRIYIYAFKSIRATKELIVICHPSQTLCPIVSCCSECSGII